MQKLRPLSPIHRPRAGDKIAATLPPLAPIRRRGPQRTLDFDIENRPLSYWFDGRCTAEVTAIAWTFIGEPGPVECRLLTHDPQSSVEMLSAFSEAYAEADMVTGHYIRRHDLPIVQGALLEHGLPLLDAKLSSDTRLDLLRFSDLPKSQEALAAMLGVRSPKESMTQADWREANRLTERGRAETYRRVVGDVRQHVELRDALLGRGMLGGVRMWRPGGIKAAA